MVLFIVYLNISYIYNILQKTIAILDNIFWMVLLIASLNISTRHFIELAIAYSYILILLSRKMISHHFLGNTHSLRHDLCLDIVFFSCSNTHLHNGSQITLLFYLLSFLLTKKKQVIFLVRLKNIL